MDQDSCCHTNSNWSLKYPMQCDGMLNVISNMMIHMFFNFSIGKYKWLWRDGWKPDRIILYFPHFLWAWNLVHSFSMNFWIQGNMPAFDFMTGFQLSKFPLEQESWNLLHTSVEQQYVFLVSFGVCSSQICGSNTLAHHPLPGGGSYFHASTTLLQWEAESFGQPPDTPLMVDFPCSSLKAELSAVVWRCLVWSLVGEEKSVLESPLLSPDHGAIKTTLFKPLGQLNMVRAVCSLFHHQQSLPASL